MSASTLWTRLAQLILAVNVLFFLGTSTIILFEPHTFQSLVQFVPFNRHYLGDAGIFQLAVSLGLLWALPAPTIRVAHIWVGTIASLLHTANHLYDLLFVSTPVLATLDIRSRKRPTENDYPRVLAIRKYCSVTTAELDKTTPSLTAARDDQGASLLSIL